MPYFHNPVTCGSQGGQKYQMRLSCKPSSYPSEFPPETHPQAQLQTQSLAENEAKGIRQFTFSVVSLRALLRSPTLESSNEDSCSHCTGATLR